MLRVSKTSNEYRYLLTYRLSQDHIELLFNTLRRRNGWNNNQNAAQFRAAMRKVLGNQLIVRPASFVNCIAQDNTTLVALNIRMENDAENPLPPPSSSNTYTWEGDHDYFQTYLNLHVINILEYIADKVHSFQHFFLSPSMKTRKSYEEIERQ